jgi:hypothetical protein
MWKTFWGPNFNRIARSNTRAVVPGAYRVEVSPAHPSREDDFLHVLEIGDAAAFRPADVRLAEGRNFKGALVAGGTGVLFASGDAEPDAGEIVLPDVSVRALLILGVKPDTGYELQVSGPGIPGAAHRLDSNARGTLFLDQAVPPSAQLRMRPLR